MPELGIMSAKQAEAVAIQALGWIAMDDEITSGFLNNSGAGVNDLAAAAKDPQFLGAVLDYVLMDDSLVIGFCDHAGLPYETPYRARQSLPGGDMVNWT